MEEEEEKEGEKEGGEESGIKALPGSSAPSKFFSNNNLATFLKWSMILLPFSLPLFFSFFFSFSSIFGIKTFFSSSIVEAIRWKSIFFLSFFFFSLLKSCCSPIFPHKLEEKLQEFKRILSINFLNSVSG